MPLRRFKIVASAWPVIAKRPMAAIVSGPVATSAVAFSALMLGSAGLLAQPVGEDGPQSERSLEEIVVTATRGEKPLMEVPAR